MNLSKGDNGTSEIKKNSNRQLEMEWSSSEKIEMKGVDVDLVVKPQRLQ